jgi:hypothetical protein
MPYKMRKESPVLQARLRCEDETVVAGRAVRRIFAQDGEDGAVNSRVIMVLPTF